MPNRPSPTPRCKICAKFIKSLEGATCNKCNAIYDRKCVFLPERGPIAATWCCPECTRDERKVCGSETPVRGGADVIHTDQQERSTGPRDEMERNRSPFDSNVDYSKGLASEMKLFREEIVAELRALRGEFQGLRMELSELKSSVKSNDERISNMDSRINALESKLEQRDTSEMETPLQNVISELRSQLNERDQDLLVNDVEVVGIPELKNENLIHIVKTLSSKLGTSIDERDIVHAERVGSTFRNRTDDATSADPLRERPRCISVRFARRGARDALLRAARVHRNITTDVLQLPSRRVYINERLTRTNRNLFYQTRQAGSQYKWKYVWTRDGKILARKEDGQRSVRIKCEEDITRNFGKLSVCVKS